VADRVDGAARGEECSVLFFRCGASIEVIDPRTVAPLDVEATVSRRRKTGRLTDRR